MLQPLAIDVSTFNIPAGVTAHIRENVARGLPELLPAICSHDGTFVIAGSGPSLAASYEGLHDERAKGRPICAVNGAHDFLAKKGIEPDLFLTIDPRDMRHNVREQTDNTVYLLASRASPIMFDYLKDRKVMLWHAASAQDEQHLMGELGIKYMIGGTSTSGLRAVNIAYYMGFRKVVMYGMDSCNAADGITKRVDGSLTGQTIEIVVGGTGKKFVANVAMAQQAQDFQSLWKMMPDLGVEIKGGGLLSAILDERKAKGMWT